MRGLRLVVKLLAVGASILVLCYVAAWLLLAYQVRRASHMLARIREVNVGESVDSIRPLLDRFHGYRWNTQLGALEDFNYVLEINPWHYPTFLNRRPGGSEHPIGNGVNARLRRAIGLRQWLVVSEIAVKDQWVVAVQAETYVEGKSMWLGSSWRVSEKPPGFKRDPTVEYLQWPVEPDLRFVIPGILEMGTGGGTYWRFWTRPSSPTVQRRAAGRWDLGCLNSFRGCDSLCELLPEAAPFFNAHSELAPRGGGWDENSRSCLKHDPYQGQYN